MRLKRKCIIQLFGPADGKCKGKKNQSKSQSREQTLNKAIWQTYEGKEDDETEFCFKYLFTLRGIWWELIPWESRLRASKEYCVVSESVAVLRTYKKDSKLSSR